LETSAKQIPGTNPAKRGTKPNIWLCLFGQFGHWELDFIWDLEFVLGRGGWGEKAAHQGKKRAAGAGDQRPSR
jgi:hypothetical protein